MGTPKKRSRGPRGARVCALALACAAALLTGITECRVRAFRGLETPAQPYDQMVDRIVTFLKSDVGTGGWREENGQPIPPYFYSYAIFDDDSLPLASYPAFTAYVAIEAFTRYYVYAGDAESLARARAFADWVLSHLTPPGDVFGSFPYSTQANLQFGGLVDGPSIELDKAAMFALGLALLYEMTDEPAYLAAAVHIADVLAARQSPDGSWPFRAIPSTGEVYRAYTSDIVPFVRLFEKLDALAPDPDYAPAAASAWAWVLLHPVESLWWYGVYEDVDDQSSFENFDAVETVRELLGRRASNPAYVQKAFRIYEWMDDLFLRIEPAFEPLVPAIGEQTGWILASYQATTVSATVQKATIGQGMAEATGDDLYSTHAIWALNVVTSCQQPDGRMHTVTRDAGGGGLYPLSWYEQSFVPVWMTLRMMETQPSLAPNDEDHLLFSTSVVKTISYGAESIAYTTRAAGTDTLKLSQAPTAVQSGGNPLPQVPDLDAVPEGWTFDAGSALARVKHISTSVAVDLGP